MIPVTKKTLVISLVFLIFASFVLADTLVLKDGRVLQEAMRDQGFILGNV